LNITAPDRPRVLLADDYLPFLETLSGLLADAFDIVALAGGGRQALDLARRLRPAVIVLDIAMPDLDGSQAAPARGPGDQSRLSDDAPG